MTPSARKPGGGKGRAAPRGTRPNGERGSAFFVVVILALTATVLIGAYLATSLAKVRHVEQEVKERSAFNAAESGLNAAIQSVWTLYRAQPPASRVAWLDQLDGNGVEADRFVVTERGLGRSSFTAQVAAVNVVGSEYADVEITARGWNDSGSHTLRAVVRYGHQAAEVFDHAYFINNFGWLWGSGVTVNGSVRSNGNFSVKDATVNGDLYAAENPEIGAAGTITGTPKSDSVAAYNSKYGDNARPTNPTAPSEDLNGNGILDPGEDANGNGALDEYPLAEGYDGSPDAHAGLDPIDMPYLGDLATYRDLATAEGGKISQGGSVIVNGVLGDDAGEEKNLILVGTVDNPIVLDGPVVIENDVVLRGYITGQGTIYAGRNVHVIGDLEYKNPPSWPKPMTDPAGTQAANATADMVGLAAKGSIILGDYTTSTWKSSTGSYQKPPFTTSYRVDPADADIGYVTSFDGAGNPIFHGDYTANDGGSKGVDTGSLSPRRFYESSFSDALVHSLAGAAVTHVDAVLYTNHLLSGRIGAATFNGTLVSRDEAIIFSSTIDINYDIRVSRGNYRFLESFLPRVPAHWVVYWNESQ